MCRVKNVQAQNVWMHVESISVVSTFPTIDNQMGEV